MLLLNDHIKWVVFVLKAFANELDVRLLRMASSTFKDSCKLLNVFTIRFAAADDHHHLENDENHWNHTQKNTHKSHCGDLHFSCEPF